MGFIQFLEDRRKREKEAPYVDAKHNPYEEKLLHTVSVTADGNELMLPIYEIRNQKAEVMGAQSILVFRGEKVPILISSPRSDSFSAGINIAMPKEVMSEFKQELERLKEEGLVSAAAKLSYNPDTKNAIEFFAFNLPEEKRSDWIPFHEAVKQEADLLFFPDLISLECGQDHFPGINHV